MQKVFIECQRAHAEEEKKAKQEAQKEKGPPTGAKRKKPDDDEKVECQHCRFELNITDPKKYSHHYNDCFHRKKQKQQNGGKGGGNNNNNGQKVKWHKDLNTILKKASREDIESYLKDK